MATTLRNGISSIKIEQYGRFSPEDLEKATLIASGFTSAPAQQMFHSTSLLEHNHSLVTVFESKRGSKEKERKTAFQPYR